jgi:hypothetical protein
VDSFDFKEMLDKTQYPSGGDLSGSIGLGSREAPLNERASLDGQCGCLALEHGRSMREEARKRALSSESRPVKAGNGRAVTGFARRVVSGTRPQAKMKCPPAESI